ncbi:regulatory signaling modulator protein AmpE [Pseudomonas sp. MIL19]|uniref:regulatory signaling modulator protein AmpE n=1 Tax=Pseudomonas sp. MIL19 TaxID=2976979 RepID=UPI001E165E61|nr:regulatory signaling modulator protein AmpE [Pseudomonas sp. MIL19]MBU0808679.1 regulatory signaling modulator protein AmpE [Gammaproteobacteria bacterium]MBU0884283.1 regulatory signaling modulator protein AmpE [Gammaproteobacteria bacterium]MBU1859186.1 regulatory signaling modulator protein AmpE [Gammaproteobacteria bacterium]MDD2162561.1 regulatory signaling modulator protein AmpE [Pseudomonas sp. MIL19]
MNFLVLLLVLWVEKFSAWRKHIQHDGPWLRLLTALERKPQWAERPWLVLAALVLLPLLVLGLILLLLEPVAYGWLALPVHLVVVIYSLGRGDLLAALGPFRDSWRRGDAEAAYLVARRDLALEADEEGELLQRVQGHLVWQAYQSFFAVIFWYALLGPVAALAYRLVALSSEHATLPALREAAVQVRHGLDWLPVRVLAASFALVGNFAGVSRALLHELLSWDISAAQLVIITARAAGEIPEPVIGEAGVSSLDGLWQLLVRAAVFWYAGFAVWTLLI